MHVHSFYYSLAFRLLSDHGLFNMYISVFLPSEEITWQELQRALAPNILSKLLQKQQEKEVTTAGTAQAN